MNRDEHLVSDVGAVALGHAEAAESVPHVPKLSVEHGAKLRTSELSWPGRRTNVSRLQRRRGRREREIQGGHESPSE